MDTCNLVCKRGRNGKILKYVRGVQSGGLHVGFAVSAVRAHTENVCVCVLLLEGFEYWLL